LALGRAQLCGSAMLGTAVAECYARGIASGLRREPAQASDGAAVALKRVERVPGIDPDGVPAVAQAGGAAQRRLAFAADPERRVGLLGRLGREDHVGEADIAALEARLVLGPERTKRREIFVRDGTALGKGRCAECCEFLLEPTGAAADGEAARGQHV